MQNADYFFNIPDNKCNADYFLPIPAILSLVILPAWQARLMLRPRVLFPGTG